MGDSYGLHRGRAKTTSTPPPLTEPEPLLPGASTLSTRPVSPTLLFLCNAVVMASYWVVFALPEIGWLRALVVMYLIFIAPGLWIAPLLWKHVRDVVVASFGVVAVSTLSSILSLIVHLAGGWALSALSAWAGAFAVSALGSGGVGWFLARRGSARSPCPTPGSPARGGKIALALAALIFTLTYGAAVHVVPPMDDLDFEAQATAAGLLRTGKPYMLTDRNTYLFFAHPILMNLWTAQSFLYCGALPQLEVYLEHAQAAERILKQATRIGSEVQVQDDHGRLIAARVVRRSATKIYLDRAIPGQGRAVEMARLQNAELHRRLVLEYEQFRRAPHLLETRIPALFFAAGATALLFLVLLQQTGGKTGWALLGTLLYAFLPEIFLRSSYGGAGLTGVTNFCFLLLLHYYWQLGRTPQGLKARRWALFAAGAFLAWVNHKGFFFPLALLAVELFQGAWRSRSLPWTLSRLWEGSFWGFALGTVLFWLYGLGCAPDQFVQEHFYYHFLNRLAHHNALGYSGYPGVVKLWTELFWSLGALWLVIAVPVCLFYLKDLNGRTLILPIVFLAGAVVYSVVDWRQTKHLMLIVVPLVVGLILFAGRLRGRWQAALGVVLVGTLMRNLWVLFQVCQDWSYLQPTPAW